VRRAVEARPHDRREPDRAGADHSNDIAGLHTAVQHAALIARGQDVRQHEHGFVAHAVGHRVRRRVSERDAHILGLRPVDQVTENPAAPTQALPVPSLATKAARAASGDAGDEHAVARDDLLHARADRLDGADRLVAQDAPVRDLGYVALQDVQVGAANRHRIHAHDHVRIGTDLRLGDVLPRLAPRPVIHECLHRRSCLAVDPMVPERPASPQGAEVPRWRVVRESSARAVRDSVNGDMPQATASPAELRDSGVRPVAAIAFGRLDGPQACSWSRSPRRITLISHVHVSPGASLTPVVTRGHLSAGRRYGLGDQQDRCEAVKWPKRTLGSKSSPTRIA
jgi:hypothetical protein